MTITRILRSIAIVITAGTLWSCAAPRGSTWAYADYNKYDENYEEFPTDKIRIGCSKDELVTLLGPKFSTIEASSEYEVLAWNKWKSVPGPDYVEKRLLVKLDKGVLTHWKVTKDTTEIVPRTW